MKRISVSILAVLALALLVSAYSRAVISQSTQSAKAKKVLVKELPKTVQGIVLENGVFKLQSGYKFVPQPNNTVAVALQSGGRGVTGSFDCFCAKEGGGGCSATTVGGTISCSKSKTNPCSDDCILRTTIDGVKAKLAIF